MSALPLQELAADALDVSGPAEWCYSEAREDIDRLEWILGDSEEEGTWVLSCPGAATGKDEMDDVVLEEAVVRDLLASHFRRWLAERGWQVQLNVRRGACVWRLADCLGIHEGGGDRLDADYPQGDDELAVLCHSVMVVAAQGLPPRMVKPG